MKIYLPTNKNAQTGKGLFINRLALALEDDGVNVISDITKKCDITLHTTSIKKNSKNGLNVVRFNGVHHNAAEDYKALNADIFNGSKKADAVIYQSEFSKQMSEKYVGEFDKPKAVICNGADPRYFESVESAESDYPINFLAFSKWRPHKRLKDIIVSFVNAQIPNSCLWIAGDIKRSGLSKKKIRRYFKRSDIIYLGPLSFPELAKYIVLADAVIHLCWFDCCPNSVVESICANKVVISNNVGGTPEIVATSGIVCNIDDYYELEPVDLYNPPKIDSEVVENAMLLAATEDFGKIHKDHVDIRNIAKQYMVFFHNILGE